jgi:hypothetical protein
MLYSTITLLAKLKLIKLLLSIFKYLNMKMLTEIIKTTLR